MAEELLTAFTYDPSIFDQTDIDRARWIILTPETLSSEERWDQETAYLRPFLAAMPSGLMLDFGCGIGRLSRVLIDGGRRVIGADISHVMLQHAETLLPPDKFVGMTPYMLATLVEHGLQMQGAIAAWVLQHIPEPRPMVELLAKALEPGAPLLIVNGLLHYLPVTYDEVPGEPKKWSWIMQAYDLDMDLRMWFELDHEEPMPRSLYSNAMIKIYRRCQNAI
jgi:SAM-dependent methyltransferase